MRYTGCQYKFTVTAVHKRSSGTDAWVIVVHHVHDAHNHPLNQQIYENYSERRIVQLNDPIVDDVQLMLRAGGRTGRIYEYLRENSGKTVVMKDVHNLLARLRASKEDLSDDALVAEDLLGLVLADSRNLVAVHENTNGFSGVISISTARMRALFARYPELLMLDCTHKTNRYDRVQVFN